MGNTVSEKQFAEQFTYGKHIATGTFATVRYCTRKCDNYRFAVKVVTRAELSSEEWLLTQNEVKILKLLTKNAYPNVVHLQHVFEDNHKIIMVLELCQDQTLLDKLYASRDRRFSEERCAQITFTIAKALEYLHSHHIVHRDLKPENILFSQDGTLKITDFGSAKYLDVDGQKEGQKTKLLKMKSMVGTPYYVAPEVISKTNRYYSSKVDLWSLGVLLYQILSGDYPFKASKGIARLYKDIARANYELSSSVWKDTSDEAKDIVGGLLCVNVDQRLSVDRVLKHEWVKKYNS